MQNTILHSYIDGTFETGNSGTLRDVINPATGKVSYQLHSASDAVVQGAIESAQRGFLVWSQMTAVERSRILLKAVNLLRKRNDELARVEVEETGKPWQEASTVDVQTGADAIEYFAHLATSVGGEQQPVGCDFFYTRKEPLGVCVGVGAWNYPLQIACWKAGPALAAGNSMIFKPSELTPKSATLLAEIFTEAGVPAGVFNVVQGDGSVGEMLTRHPEIAKVSFTGEVSTGKRVMASASNSLKSVTMELGGKSPLIVFDDADIDAAVSGAMLGNFYTQGEVCTNATRVFVHRDIQSQFVSQLLQRIEQNIVIGDPLQERTNMGALISEQHLNKVLAYIESGKREGATLIAGGNRIFPSGCESGYFIAPTVFTDCQDDMQFVKDEIFGPVMAILSFDDEDDVIKRANNTDFGLAAGVFTSNIQRAHRVIHRLHAGICWINTWGNSPVEMPVGGYKQSGIGRENGLQTFNSYTQTKSVYVALTPPESPF